MELTFSHLDTLGTALTEVFAGYLPMQPLPLGTHARMQYPRFLPLMRFSATQHACPGFGNVFVMHTRAMALMQLVTLVFTPNCGTRVPLLLIDVMRFGKKRAAFVEYYDCTASGADAPLLQSVAARYAALPEYAETPAWYVAERAPYSLIKGGTDEQSLISMLTDSVAAYASLVSENPKQSAENRAGLAAFIDRMDAEGNPSSGTMQRVLGRRGAREFFLNAIMPKEYTES